MSLVIAALLLVAIDEDAAFRAYDQDPEHPFNQVHRALFARTLADGTPVGDGELDPFLWSGSTYLLEPARQEDLLRTLAACSERAARVPAVDARRRLVLQRDLWRVFDWLAARPASDGVGELMSAVAGAMRELALSEAERSSLPAPDLAAAGGPLLEGLFETDGAWICIGVPGESVVPAHRAHVDGRSVFSVHLRWPEGREQGLRFLQELGERETVVSAEDGAMYLATDLPMLPVGTTTALVRRALTVDADGRLHPTPLVESVQVMRILTVASAPEVTESRQLLRPPEDGEREFLEFELARRAWFAGDGAGLRRLGEHRPFPRFGSHGFDHLDHATADSLRDPQPGTRLRRCLSCHGQPGVYALNSFTGTATGPDTIFGLEVRRRPHRLQEVPAQDVAADTIRFKQGQATFHALREHW